MARFRGRYDFSIDQKGRINIPSKFRKLLPLEAEDTFVISRAPAGCLWAYPKDEWEKFEDSLAGKTATRKTDRFWRMLQKTLSDSGLDKQGRISLTQHQMEVAGINKDVCIIGRGEYLEIWDTRRFEEYTGAGEDFDDLYYSTIQSGNAPTE